MARRVLEAEMLAKHGITQEPLKSVKAVEIVKEVKLHKTYNGVFSVQLNFNGDVLAVGFGAGGIQLFDTKNGNMIKDLCPCKQGGFAVMVLRWHPKESHILYAGSTDGNIYVYDTKTGVLCDTIVEAGNEINSMDFCVDGYNFATGGKDLTVRVYETKSNKLVKEWEGFTQSTVVMDKTKVGNTMRVFSIRFHPNNQFIFVSGGWDNHIKIWDIRDNDGIKRNILGPHICGDSIDILDNNILTGQWTALHALQEYNYTTGKVTREIKFPNQDGAFLYCANYINKDMVFAGGSGTNRAEIIEIATNKHIGGYGMTSPVQSTDSSNQGRVLAVGGAAPLFAIMNMK